MSKPCITSLLKFLNIWWQQHPHSTFSSLHMVPSFPWTLEMALCDYRQNQKDAFFAFHQHFPTGSKVLKSDFFAQVPDVIVLMKIFLFLSLVGLSESLKLTVFSHNAKINILFKLCVHYIKSAQIAFPSLLCCVWPAGSHSLHLPDVL